MSGEAKSRVVKRWVEKFLRDSSQLTQKKLRVFLRVLKKEGKKSFSYFLCFYFWGRKNELGFLPAVVIVVFRTVKTWTF